MPSLWLAATLLAGSLLLNQHTQVEAACCSINSFLWRVTNAADAATWPTGTQTVNADVEISCTPTSGITNLDFLAGLVTINGYLVIEHCPQLTSLEGLASLRTIRGSANQGLIIQDNDALVHLKPLERLAEVTSGGVVVRLNANLCFVRDMAFERFVSPEDEADGLLIAEYEPLSCLTDVSCDDSCHCGFCGGPGKCSQSSCKEDLAYIAGPIIAGLVLIALAVFIYFACKAGHCSCHWYCSLKHPVQVAPKAMAFPSKPQAPVTSMTAFSENPAVGQRRTSVVSVASAGAVEGAAPQTVGLFVPSVAASPPRTTVTTPPTVMQLPRLRPVPLHTGSAVPPTAGGSSPNRALLPASKVSNSAFALGERPTAAPVPLPGHVEEPTAAASASSPAAANASRMRRNNSKDHFDSSLTTLNEETEG